SSLYIFNTCSFVINFNVHGSKSVNSPPNINGDCMIVHKDIKVICSSCVKRVQLSPPPPSTALIPICPSGNISQSGQLPGRTNGAHLAARSNIAYKDLQ